MGIKYLLIYYEAITKEAPGYSYGLCGDYDYLPEYPDGEKSLKEMLDKIKAAGITPGFHFLQTFIGLESRYITPVADHRLKPRTLQAVPVVAVVAIQQVQTAQSRFAVTGEDIDLTLGLYGRSASRKSRHNNTQNQSFQFHGSFHHKLVITRHHHTQLLGCIIDGKCPEVA